MNSLFGLIGQTHKHTNLNFIADYLWLPVAVFFGGQIGSFIGARKISQNLVMKVSAILILVVAFRILLVNIFA